MLFCLYMAIFTYFLSSYMFIPFFSLYVKELGGSYVEFALVLSGTGVVLSVIQSYIGYISDKLGTRFLVIGGGSISALGLLLIGITYDEILVMPLYLIMNIGMGILIPSVFTLISYKKTMGGNSFIPIYRSIQGAGVIIGPLMGGWLMRYSYRTNVMLSGIFMIVAILLFSFYFTGKKSDFRQFKQSEKNRIPFKNAVAGVVRNKSFVIITLLFILIELSYDLIRLSLPIVGAELKFSTNITGAALSAYYVMFTLFQIPINGALKRIKKRTALMGMGILSFIPYSLLLLDISAYFTIFIMAGIGLTIGSLFTFCSVLASEESPEDKKGTYMGVFNTVLPFTDIVSPLVVAFFMNYHVKSPYFVATVLIVLFIILSGFFYSNKNSDEMQFSESVE